MSNPCDFPTLCTLPGETQVSALAKHESGPHTISTSITTSFMGHNITLCRTNRTYQMNIDINQTNATCERPETSWSFSGDVSESCSHESSRLYYTNFKEGVCLYRRLTSNINFHASAEKERVLFKVEQGYTAHGYFMPVVQSTATEEWILIKDGGAAVLYTESIPGSYNGKKIGIVGPTPDPFYAGYDKQLNSNLVELNKVGIYNLYEPCRDNSPGANSLTALDGADPGDMFFPEWCRERVDDPMWTAAALDIYLQCSQNFLGWEPYIKAAGTGYTAALNHSALPLGDYARHPVYGEMYSFLLGDRATPKCFNSLPNDIPEDVLTETLKAARIEDPLGKNTLFFPISLY